MKSLENTVIYFKNSEMNLKDQVIDLIDEATKTGAARFSCFGVGNIKALENVDFSRTAMLIDTFGDIKLVSIDSFTYRTTNNKKMSATEFLIQYGGITMNNCYGTNSYSTSTIGGVTLEAGYVIIDMSGVKYIVTPMEDGRLGYYNTRTGCFQSDVRKIKKVYAQSRLNLGDGRQLYDAYEYKHTQEVKNTAEAVFGLAETIIKAFR